jgi:fructuronate reductase
VRLSAERLGALPGDVARPAYERSGLRAGIVHLGVGAFQRAHLAAATEAALHATADLRWGITGVSLRSAGTADALTPQQGLYTLALRDAGANGAARETLQVIGAMPRVLVAPRDPGAVLDAIAAEATRIVSLTVTEKGYHHDPATRTLRRGDADLAHDLAHADAPRTTLGFIAHGLQRRRRAGRGGVTLLSCDNLPANGATLGGLISEFAQRFDAGLAAWIAAECSFPNSMVDRIVPRTTDADRERISGRLGLHDAWPVVAEPFFDWVVEDRFVAGHPAWQHGGARFVADAAPFEHAKLRLVNGCHSAIAYLGVLAGWETVDTAVGHAALRRYLERLLHDEIAPTLPATPGLDLRAYGARLLERFANPALQHRTRQIAMDGSQKIPQRWLGTVRDRLAAGAGIERLALAVAAWLQTLGGVDEAGRTLAVDDPLADALARCADAAPGAVQRVEALCSFAPVFGELGADPRFVGAVLQQAQRLRAEGVVGALASAV